jgi:hypothetical protein
MQAIHPLTPPAVSAAPPAHRPWGCPASAQLADCPGSPQPPTFHMGMMAPVMRCLRLWRQPDKHSMPRARRSQLRPCMQEVAKKSYLAADTQRRQMQ